MGKRKGKSTIVHFGVDVGFGDVKVAVGGINGMYPRKLFKFPTAIAVANQTIDLEDAETSYVFKDREYWVGDDAIMARNVFATRNLQFLFDFYPLLVFKSMELAAKHYQTAYSDFMQNDKAICVGLPIEYYMDSRDHLREIMGAFEVAGEVFNLTDNIDVIAQGQGILLDYLINSETKTKVWWGDGRTVVVLDIGYNTVDVLCVEDGKPLSKVSTMMEDDGLYYMSEQIRPVLKKKYQTGEISDQLIKKAIDKGYIVHQGQRIDLKLLIAEITKDYADYLLTKLEGRIGSFLNQSEKLIVAGGGAYFIKKELETRFPKNFCYFPESAEFANARGYLSVSQRR
jgi:plasmid segregation protein ParM